MSESNLAAGSVAVGSGVGGFISVLFGQFLLAAVWFIGGIIALVLVWKAYRWLSDDKDENETPKKKKPKKDDDEEDEDEESSSTVKLLKASLKKLEKEAEKEEKAREKRAKELEELKKLLNPPSTTK